MIAIHIKRDSPKNPKAKFSIYFQPGKRYGVTWRKKNGGCGMKLFVKQNGWVIWPMKQEISNHKFVQ